MEVTEPEEARFECEISIQSVKPPKWSLRGELLQASKDVLIEQEGRTHHLVLRKTDIDMTGTIQFAIGKAKSSANLVVKGQFSGFSLSLKLYFSGLLDGSPSHPGTLFSFFACICLKGYCS